MVFTWGKPPARYCGKCEAGWIRVPDWVARRIYQNESQTAMLRCDCRKGGKFQEYEKRIVPWKAPR